MSIEKQLQACLDTPQPGPVFYYVPRSEIGTYRRLCSELRKKHSFAELASYARKAGSIYNALALAIAGVTA